MHYTPPQYHRIPYICRVSNSVDPDQLASQKPADLDLHCFKNRIYPSYEHGNVFRHYCFCVFQLANFTTLNIKKTLLRH